MINTSRPLPLSMSPTDNPCYYLGASFIHQSIARFVMKRFAVVFLIAALVAPAPAQEQSKTARQDDKVAVGTVEVLLDVVVKDKRGRAVTDLAAADFEVFEDGVKQPVESFRLVTRNPAGETRGAGSTSPAVNANSSTPAPTVPAA